MAIRYDERTATWTFESAEDIRLFKAAQGQAIPPYPPPLLPSGRANLGQAPRVLAVLWALAKADPVGLSGAQLSPIAGLKGPQGLAAFAKSVEDYLRTVTKLTDTSSLFWKDKRPGVPATWYASREKLVKHSVIEREEVPGRP